MAWGWVEYIGDAIETGWNATVDGVTYVGSQAIDFVDSTVQYSGKTIQKGTDLVSEGMVYSAKVIDKGLNDVGTWIGETAYEYIGDKVPPIHINKQDIPYAVEGLVKNPFSSFAQLAGGFTEATGDMINQVTKDGIVSLPQNYIKTTYDFAVNNTLVNLVSSHINGPEKLETQINVKEIKDPIFIAYYPAGQEKVSQGHAAMWYRGLKVDVAPFFDNPHSVMSGDMIYGEVCEKPMFDTSSGKDVCYIYMINPTDIGMTTEKDCQRVVDRMKTGIANTRGKNDDISSKLSKDYYHGLTNNCVSAVLKSLDGYIPDAGVDSPYTLSNTISKLVDTGKAQRLSVDTFNQYSANRWKEELPQQENKNEETNIQNLWKNAFLSDNKLKKFFESNPELEDEFIKTRKLSPFDTPAQDIARRREFLLRKNPDIVKIINTPVLDIEKHFKNNPELEKEFRHWRKSTPLDSKRGLLDCKKLFLIEKEVKKQYSDNINLDFLTIKMFSPPVEKITSVLNELNQCGVKIDKNKIKQQSSNNVENNISEVILSHTTNQHATK